MKVISPNLASPATKSPATAEFGLLSDADLLDAWNRDQHRGALETLVQRYSQMVLSVCRRRCRTHTDADDAFQSTFLYLARNSQKIRHPERLVGWLHRVAQRAVLATLPSKQRESSPMVEPPAPSDDPLDRLTQRHEAIVLDEELADLPEHYRSAIVMHLYEGQSIQTLAEKLETTTGSVRGRLQRGKQLLGTRLRQRGVIPALAYAAAQSWTVSESVACETAQDFADGISDVTQLPDPPIETSLLESFLVQGVRTMTSLYTFAGVVGGGVLIALMMISDGISDGPNGQQVTLSASKSNEVQPFVDVAVIPRQAASQSLNQTDENANVALEMQAGFGGVAEPIANWTTRTVVPEAESNTAAEANEALSNHVSLKISGTLSGLPDQIAEAAGVPVLLDQRGLAFAKLDPSQTIDTLAVQDIPLRTALRMLLDPLGLKVVVEDEGLVVTANPSALVHQNIGTTRWINIDQEAAVRIARALESETSMQFVEMPLHEAVSLIQEAHSIPIAIDLSVLEDNGLSAEEPISASLKQVKLRSLLKAILGPLDLTYTVRDESLFITGCFEVEQELATRIYWLEGTGFAAGDFDSIIDALQTSVAPSTWEALGGPASIAPLTTTRPAIMVSTLYPIHETIEAFFNAMRETHFGVEPIQSTIKGPARGAAFNGTGGPLEGGSGSNTGGMF